MVNAQDTLPHVSSDQLQLNSRFTNKCWWWDGEEVGCVIALVTNRNLSVT